MFNRAPSASPPPVAQQPAQPIPSVPPLPEVRKPAAPPVDPHLLRIDLKTLRRVWLRVSVDGRIAIEREVAEGEQLPFGADRSIVVRAGDAGAVTVRVGDVDQGTIGRDGEVRHADVHGADAVIRTGLTAPGTRRSTDRSRPGGTAR